MHDPALAAKAQPNAFALDPGMPVAQGGEAIGAVGARVFMVADPHAGRVEQSDDRRGDALLAEIPGGKIAVDPGPRPST